MAIAAAKMKERVRGKDISLAPAPECHNPANAAERFWLRRINRRPLNFPPFRGMERRGKTPLN